MAEDIIDHIIDREKVSAEISATSKEIQDLLALIQSTKGKSIEIMSATSVGDVTKLQKELAGLTVQTERQTNAVKESTTAVQQNIASITKESATLNESIVIRKKMTNTLASLKAEQKEDLELLKAGTITRAEYNKRIIESTTRIEVYKQKISSLNQDIKAQVKNQTIASDSLNGLRNTLNQATKEYENLSAAQKKLPSGQALKSIVTGLTAEVSAQEQEIGKFQRNVGNYGSAVGKFAKGAFGALRTLANIIPGLGLGSLLLVLADQILSIFTNTEKLASATKFLSNAQKEAVKSTKEEVTSLNVLLTISRNTALSYRERQAAINEINKQYPEFNGNLKLENVNSKENILLSKQIVDGLIKQAKARSLIAQIATISNSLDEADRKKAELKSGFLFNKVSEEADKYKATILRLTQSVVDLQTETLKKPVDLGTLLGGDSEDLKKQTDAQIKAAIKSRKEAADAILQAEFEIKQIQLKQTIDFNKEISDNESLSYDVRLEALKKSNEAGTELIKLKAELDKKLGTKTAQELKVVEAEKVDALLRLNIKYLNDIDNIYSQENKKRSEDEKRVQKDTEKLIEDGYKIFEQREKDRLKLIADVAKQRTEILKNAAAEERSLYKSLYDELNDTVTSFFTASDDRRIADLEKEAQAVEEKRARDVDFINQTVTNRQDAAAQIAIVDAQALSEKEAIARKQKDIERERANIERLSKVAEIVGTTASGILNLNVKAAEARAQAAVLAANPLTAAFAPNALIQAGLITAQIPFVIASGALQLIKLAVPRFADGGTHKGGLMIVGDGGKSEGIELPDGTILKSPAKDTLMSAPAGTKVYPDFDKMMLRATLSGIPEFKQQSATDSSPKIVAGLSAVEKAIKKIPQTKITTLNPISQKIRGGYKYL